MKLPGVISLRNVEVVDVDPLGRLRTEVDHGRLLFHRPHEGLEHEIEEPRLRQRTTAAADRTLGIGFARRSLDARIVAPKAILALPAVNEWIGESGHVAGCFPDARVHQDRGVETLDVVPCVDHGVPPAVLHVLLELDPERPVVPHRAQPSVDLGGLKHEAPALREGDQLVHQGGIGHRIGHSVEEAV
jgi:hypothetical protein